MSLSAHRNKCLNKEKSKAVQMLVSGSKAASNIDKCYGTGGPRLAILHRLQGETQETRGIGRIHVLEQHSESLESHMCYVRVAWTVIQKISQGS